MSQLLSFAAAAHTLVALAVLALALIAWRRSGSARQGLLSAAFAWFAAAGVTTSVWLFSSADTRGLLMVDLALWTCGLLTLYFAAVKR